MIYNIIALVLGAIALFVGYLGIKMAIDDMIFQIKNRKNLIKYLNDNKDRMITESIIKVLSDI